MSLLAGVWNGIVAFVTVFALALFLISYASYRRSRHPRLLLVSAGFGLFAVKGLILSFSLFVSPNLTVSLISGGIADAVILCLLFVASVRET